VTAVVTGAAGFIGRTLVRTLLSAGHRVVGIDREPQPGHPGVQTIIADMLEGNPEVTTALAESDVVFHLAGCPGVRDDTPDIASRRHRDNVLATALVTAVVPLRTQLVVTSSSSVYGGVRHGRASREHDRLRPRGGYAESKVIVEQLCASRIEAGGLVTVVRPFTVAGEGQRTDMAIARWIAAAQGGRPLVILGSPKRTRDVTDVRQVAGALVALAMEEYAGVVNVGTGTGHTLGAVVTAIAAALDRDVETAVRPAQPAEVSDTRADTRRLRKLIGWAPETDLLAVIRRQVAAVQQTWPQRVRPGAPWFAPTRPEAYPLVPSQSPVEPVVV
jgi:nucleoside-diphosphate-sugar epimerase